MIVALIALGILAGFITGFRTGLGQWKVMGMLGVLVELILGIELLQIYPLAGVELLKACVAGFGGLLLGNSIGAPTRTFFHFLTKP